MWLPLQTIVRWVELATDRLEPIYKEIRREVFESGYVQVDETPVKYLEPGYGKVRQGYLWTTHRHGGDTAYHWETSRAAECLGRVVPSDFKGIIQTDGYEAYPCYARSRVGEIRLAVCWAHALLGFFEAQEENPSLGGFILFQLGHASALQKRLKPERADPAFR